MQGKGQQVAVSLIDMREGALLSPPLPSLSFVKMEKKSNKIKKISVPTFPYLDSDSTDCMNSSSPLQHTRFLKPSIPVVQLCLSDFTASYSASPRPLNWAHPYREFSAWFFPMPRSCILSQKLKFCTNWRPTVSRAEQKIPCFAQQPQGPARSRDLEMH